MEQPQAIQPLSKAIPVSVLLLVAVAVHLPLLLLEVPLSSYSANFHIFFASHYLHHWFNPWNTKWYAGFTQTTFPPLSQQWVAVAARVFGLDLGYMAVQLAAILFLVVGVYRFARLWVSPRAASIAALAGIFLGSESFLVYSGGQLATTFATAVYLNAVAYLYEWTRYGGWRSFIKAALLFTVAAASHGTTLLFATIFFALPVLILASFKSEDEPVSTVGFWARTIAIGIIAGALMLVVVLPFWLAMWNHQAAATPYANPTRANYILSPHWGLNYFLVPYGAVILALPFIFFRGSAVARLRPLLFGFWIAFLIGLGGTTPVGQVLLGHAFETLTMERFSYWATLLALPFVGILADELLDRFGSWAIIGLTVLAAASCGLAVAWSMYSTPDAEQFDVAPVAEWLNRAGHDQYRYFTLGFGNQISRLAILTDAESIDGEWHPGRTLSELAEYAGGPLTDSQSYGEKGMDALRAVLKHADNYGVKWVFVRDHSYDPLLYFAGWRAVDSLEDNTIVVWTKNGVPPAMPLNSPEMPPAWQGLLWGTCPIGSSILAILVLLVPDKKRRAAPVSQPVLASDENSIFGRLVS